MIRNIVWMCLFAVSCIGCQENDRLVYTTKPSVFFPDYTAGKDSVTYSFRMTKEDRDTVYLTVKLVGQSALEYEHFPQIIEQVLNNKN